MLRYVNKFALASFILLAAAIVISILFFDDIKCPDGSYSSDNFICSTCGIEHCELCELMIEKVKCT